MANSIYPNEQYILLTTVQAVAADLSVVNGVIKVGNPLQTVAVYKDIESAKIQAPVAEVLQVTTLTPTAAANSTYSFYITQWNPTNGNMSSWQYSYTTAASGDTATTIGNFFRTAINADTTIHIAATGTTTLILTAEAGYPIFYVGITETGGGLTQSTGTAGVSAINTYATLTAQGFPGLSAGATYTTIKLNVNQRTGYLLKNQETQYTTWDIIIDQAATNRAALVTAFQEELGNLVIGGAVASVENFALV
jgi:hypothetical protein